MEFPAEISSLEEIFNLLKVSLSTSDEIRKRIELAVEEVIVNIISYSGSPKLDVDVMEASGVAYITIKDWGKSFNPLVHEEVLQETEPLEEVVEGGLGIFFLKKLMDEMTYERVGDQNVLKIKKSLFNAGEATG